MDATIEQRLTRRPALLALTCLAVGGVAGLLFALGAVRLSPLLALAALGGAGLVVYLSRNPAMGLYLLAAVIPIERFGRLTDDTAAFSLSVTRGIGVAAVAGLLLHQLTRRKPLYFSLPLILWTTYVAFGVMSLTHSSDVTGGVKILSGAMGNILFLFLLSNIFLADEFDELRKRARLALLIWLMASTAVACYSIYDWHLGSGRTGGIPVVDQADPQAGAQLAKYRWNTIWEDTAEGEALSGLSLRRSMGPTSHAAVFGVNLAMTVPFFFYFLFHRREPLVWRLLLLAGLLATFYCMLLTNTRSVLLLGAGVVGLCALWGLLPLRTWMLMAGIVVALIGLLVVPVDVFNRVLDFENYTSKRSYAMRIRFDYWQAGLKAIGEHWLGGAGIGNRKVVLEHLRNPLQGRSTMHNIYLQTLMDLGVFGWLVFLSFLASVQWAASRAAKAFRRVGDNDGYWMMVAAQILMLSVLVYGLQVDVFYFPLKGWWLVAGLAVAVNFALRRDQSKRAQVIAVGGQP